MHVSNVSCAFRCMLQVLHLDVSKVDRVLHLAPSSSLTALLLDAGGTVGDGRRWAGAPSVTLFRGPVVEIGRLLWQVLNES